ncbi:histidine phosphatase family protein [archaeon]|nr:MAG: histidine phosphatase family protein [archaeon]
MMGFRFDWQLLLLFVAVVLWIFTSQENENVKIKSIFQKLFVYLDAIFYMIISKDTKGLGPKKTPDPNDIKDKNCKTKTVIFIRHGESDWNNVFNKGINPGMLVRFLLAWKDEIWYWATGHSIFIDSPLNYEGIEQAIALRKFVQNPSSALSEDDPAAPLLSCLRGDGGSSVICSSILRRAVATTTVALWPRLEKKGDKIHLLTSLQEISRNVDAYSISPAEHIADLPFSRIVDICGGKDNFVPEKVYECSTNHGNKTTSFYGIRRLNAFNEWMFKQHEQTIIVGGHSLWFKYYFQTFLPHESTHEAKSKKISNSGVVGFTIQQTTDLLTEDGQPRYRIMPDSLVVVYGGFTTK